MKAFSFKQLSLGAICAGLLALGAAAPAAQGAIGDPLFVFVPSPPPGPPILPPPVGYLAGPCGLGVDSLGRFYVADYYHHAIDVYSGEQNYSGLGVTGATGYVAQLANVDPLDGPCGLALDSTNRLYVNDFDRNVARFNASPSFGSGTTIAGAGVDSTHPTGVAVDPATDDVYVDERTYVTGYDPSGAQLMDGPNPLRIGEGTLGDGYGLAVDATGRLYVADASDNTVKVYDQTISKTTPALTITGPPDHFTSLRLGAVAVDRGNGRLYVADNLQPNYAEKPEAVIEVFSLAGAYLGGLKYKIIDALPPGLAVDNSTRFTQGRVYVTSGNTAQAGIYGYPPGSQTAEARPPSFGLGVSARGAGAGTVESARVFGVQCAGSCEAQIRSGAQVTLTATPDPGSAFEGWSGAGCAGTGACTVAMDEAKAVSASFGVLGTSAADEPVSPLAGPAGTAPTVHRAHHLHKKKAKHQRRRNHHRSGRRNGR